MDANVVDADRHIFYMTDRYAVAKDLPSGSAAPYVPCWA
jgi:hypothetical protein